MTTAINSAFLSLSRRAERHERSYLVSTFVDVGPLFTILSNRDHQIIYGRRGTGKTHCLNYLADAVEKNNRDIAVTIDMRTIGSSGGIYSDPKIPISERATRLLIDTLTNIHDAIFSCLVKDDNSFDRSKLSPALDDFADSITQVEVIGTTEREEYIGKQYAIGETVTAKVSLDSLKADIGTSSKKEKGFSHDVTSRKQGIEMKRVHFGETQTALRSILDLLASKRLWVLIDEWSEVPLDLQPYLADLLRRTLLPIPRITVKIAAIEQRCCFRISSNKAGYIGIEVGADIATSVSLDEFMVFDNDAERAKKFFRELIFKHVKPFLDQNLQQSIATPQQLIRRAFTQENVFDEFVRASEGVPRDAINIIGAAALRADDKAISVQDIRVAAKNWYNRSKEAAVTDEKARKLLCWIIDEVISHRRARAFLLKSDTRDELIDTLFDARILHVVKNSVSAHDQPGARYTVYSIDYGCYVDLITTSRAPQGLFQAETENGPEYVEVPVNDYRSIRRAILDLELFYRTQV